MSSNNPNENLEGSTAVMVRDDLAIVGEGDTPPGDTEKPNAIEFSPKPGAEDVLLGKTLKVYFDEDVTLGSGSLWVRKTSDESDVHEFNPGDADVTISGGDTLELSRSNDWPAFIELYVVATQGFVEDNDGNEWDGITNQTRWTFETLDNSQSNPLELTDSTPSNDATEVRVTTDFELVFSRNITWGASGTGIELYKEGNPDEPEKSIQSIFTRIESNKAIWSFEGVLATGTEYWLEIDEDAYRAKDDDTAFQGVDNPNELDFTTVSDTQPDNPKIVERSPEGPGTPVLSSLEATWSEAVEPGSGDMTVTDEKDGTSTQTIAAADITIQNRTMGAELSLETDTDYTADVPKGYVIATDDNADGQAETWTFSTSANEPPDDGDPELIHFNPTGSDTDEGTDLVATFNTEVITGSGEFNLYETGGNKVTTDPAYVTGDGVTVRISIPGALKDDMGYYVKATEGAVVGKDNGNKWNGISDNTTWRFTTDDGNPPPPEKELKIINYDPSIGAENVSSDRKSATVTFNKSDVQYSGKKEDNDFVTLTQNPSADASETETYDTTISLSKDTFTISWEHDLVNGDTYIINTSSTFFTDTQKTKYITPDNGWEFEVNDDGQECSTGECPDGYTCVDGECVEDGGGGGSNTIDDFEDNDAATTSGSYWSNWT